jgi:indolepyruvate ferredoxin oxidoreductase
MAGLAQKGGAVWSHLQIAGRPDDIKSVRLGSGGARVVLGCDLVVSASQKTMDTTRPGTRMVVNTHEQMTGEFTRNADFRFPGASLRDTIGRGVGPECAEFVSASQVATVLMGDSIATNMFMLGYAFQRGLIPVSSAAIEKAIELNGAAVKMNQAAFLWGRRMAHDAGAVERLLAPREEARRDELVQSLDELIGRRERFLTDYQNAAWAGRYRRLVDEVRKVEAEKTRGQTGLTEAVARYFFKLMAYKDEYEVARLHSDPAFRQKLEAQFEGPFKLRFHLAPPLLAKRDPATGELRKAEYGPWVMSAFKVLARLRFLRGTALDVFGYTQERRTERALIGEYEAAIAELLARLELGNHGLAVRIASIPEEIRGYGHVKERHLEAARSKQAELRSQFLAPVEPGRAAA